MTECSSRCEESIPHIHAVKGRAARGTGRRWTRTRRGSMTPGPVIIHEDAARLCQRSGPVVAGTLIRLIPRSFP